jgi:hypothetical protein
MLDELKGVLLCNNSLSPQHDGFPTKNDYQISFCMFLLFVEDDHLEVVTIKLWLR